MAQAREGAIQAVGESDVYFGPFRLERNRRLWHGESLVALRPQALAVLRYLAERPGQLVTKDELFTHLWPGLYVSQTVLRGCVHAIRHALQDTPVAPRFLETVGRHGYRFIGAVRTPSSADSPQPHEARARAAAIQHTPRETPYFVGREWELARLHAAFERAQQGERQIVLLSGEPGIGKTALVDRFLAEVQARGSVRIGRGQCLELQGPGEAYLPMLEALGQLSREPGGEHVRTIMRHYAPQWWLQMAGSMEPHDLAARQPHGPSSRERMLRECAEAVERLAADAVLVLVCEDLQWSDGATVEALAYLAQRRGTARLHLIGTYRPAEVVVQAHPLRRVVQELSGHGQCEELALKRFPRWRRISGSASARVRP
jgi:DNA-binding winged helix-turn-helix (wHTH) protein